MKKDVGVIGLGIMGKPMARNLMKAGFKVVVYDRTPAKVQEMVKDGAAPASSSKDVAARTEIIVTMVADSSDVEQVVLGQNSVIEGARRGATVIDMSTISPTVTQEIAGKLKEKGINMLDAPVSGGETGAIQATLAIMVGGDARVFEECLPVFNAMGKRIVHMGPNGYGQKAKLVNQVLVAGTLHAVCEALTFGAKAGLDLDKTLDAVGSGAAASWQLENLGKRILKGDFAPGFMIKHIQKDLRLILEQGRMMNMPLFSSSLANQLFQSAEMSGDRELGTQALAKVLERMAGVEARGKRA